MTLASIVNFLNNRVVLPAAASLAILAGAQDAEAKFVDTRTEKPAITATATPTDSEFETRLSFSAIDTPKQKGTIASASALYGSEPRITFAIAGESMLSDSTTGLDLRRDTTRTILGADYKFTPQFLASLKFGNEHTNYDGAIEMLTDRQIIGIRFAQITPDSSVILGFDKGQGKAEYSLSSGFAGQGDYNTTLFRLRTTHMLSGKQRRPEFEGEETLDDAESTRLNGDLFFSNAQYGSLMETQSIGARVSYVMINDKWKITPFFEAVQTEATGLVSVRDTMTTTYRAVGRIEYNGQTYTLFAQLGFMKSRTEITDEVDGNGNGNKSGIEGAIGATLKF